MMSSRGPKTPAQAVFVVVLFTLFTGLRVGAYDSDPPLDNLAHELDALDRQSNAAKPGVSPKKNPGPKVVKHLAPARPKPYPAWVPVAIAGGVGLGIVTMGALGAVTLMRREDDELPLEEPTAPEDVLFEDAELQALVAAHEATKRGG